MSVPFFDLTRQYGRIRDDIEGALERVLESQTFIMGPEVDDFEAFIADYLGAEHAIGVASGTDALLLPLRVLEAEPGDEVIVPAFTFFATAGAVWNAGLKPVFCDVDRDTFNVTVDTLEAAWTERTRAVIPVHLFGQMAPMADIAEWAASRDIVVIEDVAQALGATQLIDGEWRQAGTIGDAGAFSFFPTKNLGAFGDGGLVTAREPWLAEKVAAARTHGGRRMYHHEFVGTNSRLDALQAAVLRAKVPYLDGLIEARRENAARYGELLGEVEELELPVVSDCNRHTWNQYTLKAPRRDELRDALRDQGIGTGLYYPLPMHLQECFSSLGGEPGSLPVSESLCREVVSLPVFPELRVDEVEEVASAVRAFFSDGA